MNIKTEKLYTVTRNIKITNSKMKRKNYRQESDTQKLQTERWNINYKQILGHPYI